MPELSIVVPVFNVELFLPRCIESILAQDYEDYELILVNDGSTDSCNDIIKQYAARDKRIIVISQPNRGVSSARNRGLITASGKYISFIDADDWIEAPMYGALISCMKENNVELGCCNWCRNFEDGHEEEHHVYIDDGRMSVEEFVGHIFDSPRTIGGSICNKVFIREKIAQFFDESVRLCEDNLFLLHYCAGIHRTYYSGAAYYHIYERKNSATRGEGDNSKEILSVREKLIAIAGKTGVRARNAAEGDFLDQCYYYMISKGAPVAEIIKRCIRKYCRSHFREIILNDCISLKLKIRYFLI
jgi:glycosyltransferase involved in cell wall biosynthesis